MNFFVTLALFFVAGVLAAPTEDVSSRIVGGVNAIPGEFPFIVSLQWVLLGSSSHVCGGVILSTVWVISAAHCVTETPTLGRLDIYAGRHNLALSESEGIRRTISTHILHPDWRPGGAVGPDDLVLMLLSQPLPFNARIRSIRLPQANVIPTGPATLSGWGTTGGILPSSILQKIIKPVITIPACRDAIFSLGLNGSFVDYTNVCTGPLTGGVSACSGDSGGPLIQGAAPNEVLIGIVSWGITPCGTAGAPSGVYKLVSAYTQWIFTHTGISPS